MRACACGECSTFRCSMPSISVSMVNSAGRHDSVPRRPDAGADDCPAASSIARPVDGVLDRAISGAAAQVSLQGARQVQLLLVGERRRRHDHARGAEAALEAGASRNCRCIGAGSPGAEALDRGDLAAVGAECRCDATVHRIAVEPHRAGTAIACVATLFDAETSQRAHECAQALPGTRLFVEELPFTV